MAIWFASNQNQGTQAECYADSASDVTDLETFARENHLKPGSSCLILSTSEVYMLNTEGQWNAL